MKTVRWLLSHSFLILLIVAVTYGYMFRESLADRDTPTGKAIAYLSTKFDHFSEFVAAVKDEQKKSSEQKPVERYPVVSEHSEEGVGESPAERGILADATPVAGEDIGETVVRQTKTQTAEITADNIILIADVDESSASDHAVIESDDSAIEGNIEADNIQQDKALEQQQVSTGYSDAQVKQSDTNFLATVIEPMDNVPVADVQSDRELSDTGIDSGTEKKDNFVSTEIEKQLGNVDKHGGIINSLQKNEVIKAKWVAAREFFHQREYGLSEQKYKEIIANTKDNYDALGELGNVYFYQGKTELAVQAYFEAAVILVEKGQARRAGSLAEILHALDPSKAVELQKLIDDLYSSLGS